MKLSSCTIPDLSVPVFKSLSAEESLILAQSTLKVQYKKGESVFKQGTFASHIVYVKEGLIKAYVEACNEILVLKIGTPDNFLALSAIADGNKVFPYSAKAYITSELLLFDIDTVRSLSRSNIDFSNDLVNLISMSYNLIIGRFFCLTYKQLYGRLADILLCLSEKIFKSNTFELNLSREELGELTKMSAESVIRMLKKFKDDGIIQMDGKFITIIDFDQLRKISDYG